MKKATKKKTAKKKAAKECQCVAMVNDQLASTGYRLASRMKVAGGKDAKTLDLVPVSPVIEVERINQRGRKRSPGPVLCSFCPFCGVKIDHG